MVVPIDGIRQYVLAGPLEQAYSMLKLGRD
jgi:hypothetical protein